MFSKKIKETISVQQLKVPSINPSSRYVCIMSRDLVLCYKNGENCNGRQVCCMHSLVSPPINTELLFFLCFLVLYPLTHLSDKTFNIQNLMTKMNSEISVRRGIL